MRTRVVGSFTMVLALCLAAASVGLAQPAASGHSHPLGWSFDTPAGWRVQHLSRATALAPPSRSYDLTRPDQGHLFLVTAFDDITDPESTDVPAQLARTLAHNGWEPLGVPARDTVRAGDRAAVVHTWTYQPRRRAAFMQVRAYLVPDGGATLALIAATERDLLEPLEPDLVALAASLRFAPGGPLGRGQWTDWGFDREQPPGPGMPDPGDVLADESVPSQQWFFYLRGKRIAPVPGNPSARARGDALDLRDDGTFRGWPWPGEPGTTVSGPPRGRWRIVTRAGVTALVLYWERGDPTYHRLDRRGDTILVDDVPTTVVRPSFDNPPPEHPSLRARQ